MAATALTPLLRAFRGDYIPPESVWRTLNYFHLYRFFVACLFVAAVLVPGGIVPFGGENISFARWVAIAYWMAAILIPLAVFYKRPPFNLLLSAEVFVDIVALTLLMATSGGSRSGVSYLLLVVLAAAGLLGQGRLTLFYAALATIGVFLEQGHRLLQGRAEFADFSFAGVISIGFFATAGTASMLARRVVANEALAQRRGEELANQMEINLRVIRDMQEGVLVVDASGAVVQYNPSATRLWACFPGKHATLGEFSPQLAERYAAWHESMTDEVDVMRSPRNQKALRVRYVPAAGSTNALLYIEDMEMIQAQAQTEAQQIKLVALGRLTANMAHEIRNPLAAISHAAELLAESQEADLQKRLSRIIGDNARRLNGLVTDVMELGRRDRARPEVVRLREVVAGVVDELVLAEPTLRNAVTLEVADSLRILFDRSHLHRVLTNMIENASHFCNRDGGGIRVGAEAYASGKVALTVTDDGPGVAPDLRDNLFEPFFTTRKGGTGLGLYIARELCEANGASLALVTTAKGACFRIDGKGSNGGEW